MITSPNFNISLRVGPRGRGGTEKKRATDARAKHAQVAAPGFWTQQDEKGQLFLLKSRPEWGTKLPQSQSKNDTSDNVENKPVSRAQWD